MSKLCAFEAVFEAVFALAFGALWLDSGADFEATSKLKYTLALLALSLSISRSEVESSAIFRRLIFGSFEVICYQL